MIEGPGRETWDHRRLPGTAPVEAPVAAVLLGLTLLVAGCGRSGETGPPTLRW